MDFIFIINKSKLNKLSKLESQLEKVKNRIIEKKGILYNKINVSISREKVCDLNDKCKITLSFT